MYVMLTGLDPKKALDLLGDLGDFSYMKKPQSILEYPIVIRKVLESITISSPDLSIWDSLPSPKKVFINNRYVTQMDDEFALALGRHIIKVWRNIDNHIQEKKWAPEASDIKNSVQKSEKALSIIDFHKLVLNHVQISINSLRRDLDKNAIQSYKTTGGHRRIPASELMPYLDYLKNKKDRLKELREITNKVKLK